MRASSDTQRRDLTTMVWSLLNDIGVNAFAACTRAKVPALSKYGSHSEDLQLPVDVLLDAEIVAQNPKVTRWLAEVQGYQLVPIAPAPPPDTATIADVLRATKEAGDVSAAWLKLNAETGDEMDLAARREMHREIDEAVTALLALRKGI
jgi:hypothetical protein